MLFTKNGNGNGNGNEYKMNKETLYSSTPFLESESMLKVIENMGFKIEDIMITDATAHVGGDICCFQYHNVKCIQAIEINSENFEQLIHNISINTNSQSVIRCINNDYLQVKDDLKQDILYIDAPWGGPRYKKQKVVNLFLSDKNVIDIAVDELLTTFH